MGSIGPTAAQVEQVRQAVKTHGKISAAARVLGMPRKTVSDWVSGSIKSVEERASVSAPVNDIIENLRRELDTAKEALREAQRPRFTIRQDVYAKGDKIKVLVIGDAHDSPHIPDKSRFTWIGKYINETRPDVVIQIGDFMTADSVSAHTGNHTLAGKTKPIFEDDIRSFRLALDALDSEIKYNPQKHCTLGNHERRIYLYEDEHPEVAGKLSCDLDLAFRSKHWEYSPYGQPTFYGGVAFLHAAINRLGKTFGGKTAENQIANESLTDVVIGHSHIKRVVKYPKLHHRHITVANAGCALPEGYIEDYAQHAQTGWSYGLMTLTIKDGHIRDDEWVSMGALQEKYA